jgi:hypothetical protein
MSFYKEEYQLVRTKSRISSVGILSQVFSTLLFESVPVRYDQNIYPLFSDYLPAHIN